MRLHAHAQNSMADTEVELLGDRGWYQGTFDVQTKLARAVVIERHLKEEDERVMVEYQSAGRAYGWVGDKETTRAKVGGLGKMEVVSSMGDVLLRFGDHQI